MPELVSLIPFDEWEFVDVQWGCAAHHNGVVYALPGKDNTVFSQGTSRVLKIDVATNAITELTTPEAGCWFTWFECNGFIYAIPGREQGSLMAGWPKRILKINPVTDAMTFIEIPSLLGTELCFGHPGRFYNTLFIPPNDGSNRVIRFDMDTEEIEIMSAPLPGSWPALTGEADYTTGGPVLWGVPYSGGLPFPAAGTRILKINLTIPESDSTIEVISTPLGETVSAFGAFSTVGDVIAQPNGSKLVRINNGDVYLESYFHDTNTYASSDIKNFQPETGWMGIDFTDGYQMVSMIYDTGANVLNRKTYPEFGPFGSGVDERIPSVGTYYIPALPESTGGYGDIIVAKQWDPDELPTLIPMFEGLPIPGRSGTTAFVCSVRAGSKIYAFPRDDAPSEILVIDTDPVGGYLPVSAECGVIDANYAQSMGAGFGWTFSPTNDAWTATWSETHTADAIRWSVRIHVLEDLPFESFAFFGGTISNDGGFGEGTPPTQVSLSSAALDPEVTDEVDVFLDPVATTAGAASVSTAGGGNFYAGSQFTISFSVPKEFPVYAAFIIPGVEVVTGGLGFEEVFDPGADLSFGIVSTAACDDEGPNFQLTWLEAGSKTYERGVDRGVLYFDDGRVVPWSGLTAVGESAGRNAESVYFDGVKLSEIVTPEGFTAQVSAITYPKQFEEAYGNLSLRRGVYLGGQRPRTFGFSYRTRLGTDLDEDAGYKLHLVYNILAIPSNRSYSTISDEPNITQFEWEFKTTPETAPGYRPSAYLVIDSTKVTPSLLTEIEGILYGTEEVPPRLPSLAELLSFINEYNNFINIIDNGDGTWEANTLATGIINALGDETVEIREANVQYTSPDTYLISPTPDPPA